MSEEQVNEQTSQPLKRVGTGLLVAGWIFTILGGLIGIIIASSVAFGKQYDEESHRKGKPMFITAIVLMVVYIIIRIATIR